MTRHLFIHRALLLSLGVAGTGSAPGFADTRAPLQVGVTVRSACQIASRLSPASAFRAAPGVEIRCPRGTPYALSISPPVESQPVAVKIHHAQTITVIF